MPSQLKRTQFNRGAKSILGYVQIEKYTPGAVGALGTRKLIAFQL
jgi:hypothetical protein